MEDCEIKHKLLEAVVSQSRDVDSELSDFEEVGTPYPRGAHLSDSEQRPYERARSESKLQKLNSTDILSKELETFYDCRVQPVLARKQRCEDIAYAVTHKVLRKVQTVDDRFRGSNLVPHGIPYDGLRAGEPIHFDMILSLPLGQRDALLVKKDGQLPFVRIQPMSDALWSDCTTKGGFISASKVQAVLRKYIKQAVHVIRKYISQCRSEKYPKDLKSLFVEGMSKITLIINRDINVRILPAFCIPDSRADITRRDCPSSSHVVCYEKTPVDFAMTSFLNASPNSEIGNPKNVEIGWRVSFYVAEKNKMRALANGCRIQLLRTLTEIRDNEAGLMGLSSYHLKTLLFYACDDQPDVKDWDQNCLADRFLDLLKRLRRSLLEASLPHYFMRLPEFPPFNLLDGVSPDSLHLMADFVENLLSNPQPYLSNDRGKKRDELWPWETEFDPMI